MGIVPLMGFEDVIGVRKKDYSSSKKDHVNTVNDSVFNKKKIRNFEYSHVKMELVVLNR